METNIIQSPNLQISLCLYLCSLTCQLVTMDKYPCFPLLPFQRCCSWKYPPLPLAFIMSLSIYRISSTRMQIFSGIFHLKRTKTKIPLTYILFLPGPISLLFQRFVYPHSLHLLMTHLSLTPPNRLPHPLLC